MILIDGAFGSGVLRGSFRPSDTPVNPSIPALRAPWRRMRSLTGLGTVSISSRAAAVISRCSTVPLSLLSVMRAPCFADLFSSRLWPVCGHLSLASPSLVESREPHIAVPPLGSMFIKHPKLRKTRIRCFLGISTSPIFTPRLPIPAESFVSPDRRAVRAFGTPREGDAMLRSTATCCSTQPGAASFSTQSRKWWTTRLP
mmetsp:Transcript_28248/g.79748  ORF Transcript_28248/g.79748 Transcript_28248/m.79748 type:complete len:200 (+) Transcript_28248:646-1245(+)